MNFAENLVATTSHMMFFFSFCRPLRFKQFIWWNNGKLGEGIHRLIQSCVVMQIRGELHLLNGYYESLKEKEDHVW